MDEGDVVGQGRGDVRIALIDQCLDLLQEGIELAHGLLQEVQVAILRTDGLLPIPLIYIERVEIVQLLVAADGIHIGIEAVACRDAIGT